MTPPATVRLREYLNLALVALANQRSAHRSRQAMSATGLDVFDKTLQTTNIWLNEIMDDLGPDRKIAYRALRAVLHALRDRLTVDEAAQLGAQLPLMIRGLFFDMWHPAGKP